MANPSKMLSGIEIGAGSAGINFQKTEAKNMLLQNLASDPASPVKGQYYINTSTNRTRYFNGTVWVEDVELTPETAGSIGTLIAGSTSKATLVDADKIAISDSAASNVLKHWTYANLKAQLLAWLQGLNFMTNDSTHTLTNKTINANGTGMAITNLETADFASGVIDTDVALTSNSDSKLATQKATKAYSDSIKARSTHTGTQLASTISDFAATVLATVLAGISFVTSSAVTSADSLLVAIGKLQAQINSLNAVDGVVYKGFIDASTNPNYPAANAGDMYKFSVAGRIGGGSGPLVTPQDTMYCTVDGSGANNHATVGANWTIIQSNVDYATNSVSGLVKLAVVADVASQSDSTLALTPLSTLNVFARISNALLFGNGGSITFTFDIADPVYPFISAINDAIVTDVSTGEKVYPTILGLGSDEITIEFPTAPTTNQYAVVLIGL